MPENIGYGIQRGLGSFADALMRIAQSKRQRTRERQLMAGRERDRERQDLLTRLQLMSTPGVRVGEPQAAGPGIRPPEATGPSTPTNLPGAVTEGPQVASAGGFTDALLRRTEAPSVGAQARHTLASMGEPEEGSLTGSLQRLGAFGGEPVYFDPEAARRASRPQRPWEEAGFSSPEAYLQWTRRSAAAGRQEPRPKWIREGFDSPEAYLQFKRRDAAAGRPPERDEEQGVDPGEVRQVLSQLEEMYQVPAESYGETRLGLPRQQLLDLAERIAAGDTTVVLPEPPSPDSTPSPDREPEEEGGPGFFGRMLRGIVPGGGEEEETPQPGGVEPSGGLEGAEVAPEIREAREAIQRSGLSKEEARRELAASGADPETIERILSGIR